MYKKNKKYDKKEYKAILFYTFFCENNLFR